MAVGDNINSEEENAENPVRVGETLNLEDERNDQKMSAAC
jgi:hypothetical protein